MAKDETVSADDIIATAAPATKLPSSPIMTPLINGASILFRVMSIVSGLLRASSVMTFVTIPGACCLVLRWLLPIHVRR